MPAISAAPASSRPSSRTSANVRDRGPACGSIAEWNFSAPPREARHWKNSTESAPRATACHEPSRMRPGAFGRFTARQLTALGACSSSSHGMPPFSDRSRS